MNGKQALTGAYRRALQVVGGRGWGRVYPLNLFNEWLTTRALPRLKTRTANVHGHVMQLDAQDSLGLSIWGTWEPFETELLQSLAQPGDVVVDVGANIGYFTLLLARRVGPQGRVFAFEPSPDNFEVLRENVARNGYQTVRAEQKAVSDADGFATLQLSNENHGDHRLKAAAGSSSAVQVETTTLDAYFRQIDANVRLIKMDVQGSELRVLRGMRELLARQGPLTMVIEFFPPGLEQMGDDPAALLAELRAHGFTLQEISESKHAVLPIGADWYDRARFGDEGFTNLLCTRS